MPSPALHHHDSQIMGAAVCCAVASSTVFIHRHIRNMYKTLRPLPSPLPVCVALQKNDAGAQGQMKIPIRWAERTAKQQSSKARDAISAMLSAACRPAVVNLCLACLHTAYCIVLPDAVPHQATPDYRELLAGRPDTAQTTRWRLVVSTYPGPSQSTPSSDLDRFLTRIDWGKALHRLTCQSCPRPAPACTPHPLLSATGAHCRRAYERMLRKLLGFHNRPAVVLLDVYEYNVRSGGGGWGVGGRPIYVAVLGPKAAHHLPPLALVVSSVGCSFLLCRHVLWCAWTAAVHVRPGPPQP